MCTGKDVDYKDAMIISKYVNEKGENMIYEYFDVNRING